MPAPVEYFGVRHHGPGSVRALENALAELEPALVLIEGPADASELLPLLGESDMIPPVALLAYDAKEASNAAFWPFAEYSPEYRAVRFALDHGVEPRFIDLPAAATLHERQAEPSGGEDGDHPDGDPAAAVEGGEDAETSSADASLDEVEAPPTDRSEAIRRDPIGALARVAGYEDGESWWSDLIEENPEPGPVFSAIADAVAALREGESGLPPREARREAFMRVAIAKARKETDGPIAVVCGAWHIPALTGPHKLKDDRALLKGLPKVKAALTWAPWTSPRLASLSGYGAGVRYPGWYQHLWRHGADQTSLTRWLLRMAHILRRQGHLVSTASLIEAERLAVALASLRQRPSPNFEELREAAVSCLCFGESLLYQSIAEELLIGAEVGEISANTPLAPLLDDLKTQQRKAKLKPEALERELAVDLRSESGLFRSTLLHRLQALGVPWGRLTDAGRSRGTFRERWVLKWEPEYSVKLVEQLVYGPTIEQAAAQHTISQIDQASTLAGMAQLLSVAMTAQLPDAVRAGVDRLGDSAAHTSDCRDLLEALPPMADVLRYGEARAGVTTFLGDLLRQIALQACVALPYAVRDLDADATSLMNDAMVSANRALQLAELAPEDLAEWHDALRKVVANQASTPLLAGLAARLLYESEEMGAEEAARLLRRRLSPGTVTIEAAGYFEGFLAGITERLIHDEPLLAAVDQWLMDLPEEDLTQNLPLFHRVFSNLDKHARKRLVDAIVRPSASGGTVFELVDDQATWTAHAPVVLDILEKGAPQ